MTKIVTFTLLSVLLISLVANNTVLPLSDNTQISLLTSEPHDEVQQSV
jgi:hypothetical protein